MSTSLTSQKANLTVTGRYFAVSVTIKGIK